MLLDPADSRLPAPGRTGALAAHLLPQLVDLCADTRRTDALWLLLTAAFGAFPTGDQLRDYARYLELTRHDHAASALLAQVINDPRRGRVDLPMSLAVGTVVVDVDFCARHDTHTGIHRVVRETLPRWAAAHEVRAVAWIDEYSAFRELAPREHARVFAYGRDVAVDHAAEAAYAPRLVVPWHSVVVLADVPNPDASGELAAMGRYSGSTLSAIGYDMIPITSAEMRPPADAVAFAQYLTVVKNAHRLAGISTSATAEFAGFTQALAAQGLPGPQVREVQLAGEALDASPAPRPASRGHRPSGPVPPGPPVPPARPVMLCLGSKEPHKNQRAALHAAERLWREGVDLEVRLVGGSGWSDAVLRPVIDRLQAAGRPLSDLGRVSDARLEEEMRSASFVFFASLHEGYGLPVAEALACGTPVITSSFGSQLEIAELGGCLVVDPRDDDDMTAAVRRLVSDPAELDRLRREAAARPVRTWDEYAAELWDFLAAGKDSR